MALHDIEPQLLALNPAEKAQAVQILLQSLGTIWAGIEKTPGTCGGDARVAKTRIPVWVLVQARNLGNSDAEILQNYPTLTAIDLTNAWLYAVANPREIEATILENEVA